MSEEPPSISNQPPLPDGQTAVVPARAPVSTASSLKEGFGLITGIGALVYVFGFIVINSYLGKQGVSVFSAVSTQYVAAGLCFALFYLVAAIPVNLTSQKLLNKVQDLAHSALQEKLKQIEAERSEAYKEGYKSTFEASFIIGALLPTAVPTYVVNCVLTLLCFAPLFYFAAHDNRVYSGQVLLWIALVPIGVNLVALFRRVSAAAQYRLLPFILITLLFSAFVYGRAIYPYITAAIGGGQPSRVKFVIDPASKALLETELNLNLDSNVTPVLNLVLEMPDSLIVNVAGKDHASHFVQLKKDQIKAVQYSQ